MGIFSGLFRLIKRDPVGNIKPDKRSTKQTLWLWNLIGRFAAGAIPEHGSIMNEIY